MLFEQPSYFSIRSQIARKTVSNDGCSDIRRNHIVPGGTKMTHQSHSYLASGASHEDHFSNIALAHAIVPGMQSYQRLTSAVRVEARRVSRAAGGATRTLLA